MPGSCPSIQEWGQHVWIRLQDWAARRYRLRHADASAACCSAGRGQLSRQAGHHRHAIPGRRHGRHARTPDCVAAGGGMETVGHRGKQARRFRHDRQRGRSPGSAGWLHLAHRHHPGRAGALADPEPAVRHPEGLYAPVQAGQCTLDLRDLGRLGNQVAQGLFGTGRRQPGQVQFRLLRCRNDCPYPGRDLQQAQQDSRHAHTLQGLRAADHRHARRPCDAGLHGHEHHAALPVVRQDEGLCGVGHHALVRAAGHTDVQGAGLQRLRRQRLVRPARPGKHAARCRKKNQQRRRAHRPVA